MQLLLWRVQKKRHSHTLLRIRPRGWPWISQPLQSATLLYALEVSVQWIIYVFWWHFAQLFTSGVEFRNKTQYSDTTCPVVARFSQNLRYFCFPHFNDSIIFSSLTYFLRLCLHIFLNHNYCTHTYTHTHIHISKQTIEFCIYVYRSKKSLPSLFHFGEIIATCLLRLCMCAYFFVYVCCCTGVRIC